MLETIKNVSNSITTKASEVKGEISDVLTTKVGEIKEAVSETAASVSDKTIRASIDRLRNILEVAADELSNNPLPGNGGTIAASIAIGMVSLEIQISVPASKRMGLQDVVE